VRQDTRVGGGCQAGAPLHGPLWVDTDHQAFGGMGGYEIALCVVLQGIKRENAFKMREMVARRATRYRYLGAWVATRIAI
jgi:hypothetical protein